MKTIKKMRKVKYNLDIQIGLNGEIVKFQGDNGYGDGWLHAWKNSNGIIETVHGNMVKIPYTNFVFMDKPKLKR